eukprot:2854365-Rhodomonas_salina.1
MEELEGSEGRLRLVCQKLHNWAELNAQFASSGTRLHHWWNHGRNWGALRHRERVRHQSNWRREAACRGEVCGWRELVAGAFYRNGCLTENPSWYCVRNRGEYRVVARNEAIKSSET